MARRIGLALTLGVAGLCISVLMSSRAVAPLTAGSVSCGTVAWNSEVPVVCDGTLNRQQAIVVVLFLVAQALLLSTGLLFAVRRPSTRFRPWVAPFSVMALVGSLLFLLPGAITDAKRSDGDPTTTAQWLYLLGS